MGRSPAPSSFPTPNPSTLEAIRSGDRVAADGLIRACEPKLLQLARRHAPSAADADVLAAAGRCAIWRAASKYDPHAGPFDHYATRAVLNAMRTELRILRAGLELELSEEAFSFGEGRVPEPFDAADARGHGRRIRRAVRALPGSEFDVLFLIYGCSYSERRVASVLGVSQPRVSQLRKRALTQLSAAWTQNSN